MFRLILISLISLSLAVAGCTRESDSPQKVEGSTPTAAEPTNPESMHDSSALKPNQGLAEPDPFVIDVDVNAEIGGVVRCVFQDSRGVLWLGGEGSLFRNDGKKLTSYDIKDDLGRGVTIKGIVEDKEGNIWCGTTGGVTRIDGASFTSFGRNRGLINRDVWSIAADPNGVLWVGTLDGAFRFDGTTFTNFAIPEAEPDPTRGITSSKIVHCITVDRQGQVWFGTNGGAYRYDGQVLANYSEKEGLSNNAISSIVEDKSGNMWFGTIHKGICRYDGKVFTNFTKDGVINGDEIWCIHEDHDGNIWFSGKRFGLYRYHGNSFTKFDERDGLTSPGIMSIVQDNQGQLWLGGGERALPLRRRVLFQHDERRPLALTFGLYWPKTRLIRLHPLQPTCTIVIFSWIIKCTQLWLDRFSSACL